MSENLLADSVALSECRWHYDGGTRFNWLKRLEQRFEPVYVIDVAPPRALVRVPMFTFSQWSRRWRSRGAVWIPRSGTLDDAINELRGLTDGKRVLVGIRGDQIRHCRECGAAFCGHHVYHYGRSDLTASRWFWDWPPNSSWRGAVFCSDTCDREDYSHALHAMESQAKPRSPW